MSEQHQIDSWVASYTCDIVESFTHLEEIIGRLRWRMLRGEPLEMQKMMYNAKKHARELRARLDGLGYFALDAASSGRQAQRIASDEMPLTMVEQVRRGGAASSTDSSRGSKVFSNARISRRAR
jgi:hypothetical protein